MLTKNLTGFLFGARLTSTRPPAPEMTLVVRGAFTLRPGEPLAVAEEQGKLSAEVFAEDDDERAGACLCPDDFAEFKLRGEVLLAGTCHAPGGAPLAECPVRFSVGSWSKTLRVSGPRAWSDDLPGAAMSKPVPFTSMPLDYTHAFGGPGYERNPSGKGYRTRELPNVEHPSGYVRAHGDAPDPAGFGPLSARWPERAQRLGTRYGGSWRRDRAPFSADDFDWAYWNAAPADQQLDGYLRGDEEVGFVNLHRDAPSFAARLPALRVRVFVHDRERRFREVPMMLDTLFAKPDDGLLLLTWRGVTGVKEDDFADVTGVLVASEPLFEPRVAEEHYRRILEKFEADPLALEEKVPPEAREVWGGIQKARKARAAGEAPTLDDQLGSLGAGDQKRIRDTLASLKEQPGAKLDVDAAVARASRAAADAPPVAVPIKPGVFPDIRLRDRMRKTQAVVEQLKAIVAAHGGKQEQVAKIAELEAVLHDPRLQKLDPSYTPPGPISADEPGPGRDLSEQDLSHRDLAGLDLSGANLESTVLTGANLRGAKLVGAKLRRAILFKADLEGADLSNADLTQVNAADVRAPKANLSGANLEIAYFKGADLTGARLEDASGAYVVFTNANLAGVKAARARLDRSDFTKASLEGADFSAASLVACELGGAGARAIDLTGAELRGARFASADVAGAKLVRARGIRSYWAKANLDGADLTLATFEGAHFTEASAVGAKAFGANLKNARLDRANLERAELVKANLFEAVLRKARVDHTRLDDANLYGADLRGAAGKGAELAGANLRRSTLEHA